MAALMGRLVSILLLVALVLTPAATSICLSGSAPACCAPAEGSPSTAGGTTALSGRGCDCCVTVDASPVDRASSVSRPLAASAVALSPASAPLLSRTPRAVDRLPRGTAADSRLVSIRAVVLLV
jgi:hypothetical protein